MTLGLEVLAVVPARGGSRGLPGKNLAAVGGRPLVTRAVEAALRARHVTRVVGTTDDPRIAAVMAEAGAEVPGLRPTALAGDDVPDAPVLLHVLDVLEAGGTYRPDIVVNVRPTAPLRLPQDVDGALETLCATPEATSVKAVAPAPRHPLKMWLLNERGLLEPFCACADCRAFPVDAARQCLPEAFQSTAIVDAVWADALRRTRQVHSGPVAAYVVEPARDVDVDTAADLLVADCLLERS
jgi:N-acylneuraminate cytidylyltransferase